MQISKKTLPVILVILICLLVGFLPTYGQTFENDFLRLYAEYEKICGTPARTKVLIEYKDIPIYWDDDGDYIIKVWVATVGDGWNEYYDRRNEIAWKYETKTYKPCFEGFILFLKGKKNN